MSCVNVRLWKRQFFEHSKEHVALATTFIISRVLTTIWDRTPSGTPLPRILHLHHGHLKHAAQQRLPVHPTQNESGTLPKYISMTDNPDKHRTDPDVTSVTVDDIGNAVINDINDPARPDKNVLCKAGPEHTPTIHIGINKFHLELALKTKAVSSELLQHPKYPQWS